MGILGSICFLTAVGISLVHGQTAFQPPLGLIQRPISTHERLLVGGGPGNQYPRSRAALDQRTMGNFEPATTMVLTDIRKGLRYLFQTNNLWSVALSGCGSSAIDAVLDNLIEPGDRVLTPTIGFWGERTKDIAERFGAEVVCLDKPLGSAVPTPELIEAIEEHRPTIVYITNGESSTGVIQKLDGVGAACRKFNCLLVVDVVATIGVVPFHMDLWQVDAVIANTQKGIGAPASLAPISYGPRALLKIMGRKSKPRFYSTDLKNSWISKNFWKVDPNTPQTFHSSYPIIPLYALRESLATLASERLEHVWARHGNMSELLYSKLEEMGLEYFVPNKEDRLPGTVTLIPPEGIDPVDLTIHIRTTTKVELNVGIGPTWGKVIRIGLIGPNATPEIVDTIIKTLRDGLIHFGWEPPKAAGTSV